MNVDTVYCCTEWESDTSLLVKETKPMVAFNLCCAKVAVSSMLSKKAYGGGKEKKRCTLTTNIFILSNKHDAR